MPRAAPQHRITRPAPKHKVRAAHEGNRLSARQRGYDTQWDKFREGFLASNPLCQYCLGRGTTEPATVVDHDLPHDGDIELFWNNTYTALCKQCHDSTKARLEARYSGDALLEAIARMKGLVG